MLNSFVLLLMRHLLDCHATLGLGESYLTFGEFVEYTMYVSLMSSPL